MLVIEKQGNYKNIKYICAFNLNIGFRVGYVILDESCADKINSDELEVHGGITYEEITNSYPVKLDEEKFVLGFDCGHGEDKPDIESWKKLAKNCKNETPLNESYIENISQIYNSFPGQVRTLEYVKKECEKLIDQVLKQCSN